MPGLEKQQPHYSDRAPEPMIGGRPYTLQVNDLDISVCSSREAKAAIDLLRAHKKQLLAEKKEVNARIAQLRAQSRDEEADERAVDGPDGRDPTPAAHLDDAERERTSLVRQLRNADSGIAQLEAFILSNAIAEQRTLMEQTQAAIRDAGGI